MKHLTRDDMRSELEIRSYSDRTVCALRFFLTM